MKVVCGTVRWGKMASFSSLGVSVASAWDLPRSAFWLQPRLWKADMKRQLKVAPGIQSMSVPVTMREWAAVVSNQRAKSETGMKTLLQMVAML